MFYNDGFYCIVVRVKCEEFYHYSPSEAFVVQTADQFFGTDNGPLEQQKQYSHVCLRNCRFFSDFKGNQSPHYK